MEAKQKENAQVDCVRFVNWPLWVGVALAMGVAASASAVYWRLRRNGGCPPSARRYGAARHYLQQHQQQHYQQQQQQHQQLQQQLHAKFSSVTVKVKPPCTESFLHVRVFLYF